MILVLVIGIIFVAVVFLFAYNFVARRDSVKAHHERLGETNSLLALSIADLIFQQLHSRPAFYNSLVDQNFLCSTSCQDYQVDSTRISLLIKTINDNLAQFPDQLGGTPRCDDLAITFSEIQPIAPSQAVDQLQAGRDSAEKSGIMTVKVKVDYLGLMRSATVKRQFRVVSMVPGPFARFTLFTAFTPWFFGYNAIGTHLDGTVDSSYTHTLPGNVKFSAPLKLINGVDSENEKATVMKQRGWVFLGPVAQGSDNAPLLLQIPAGYGSNGGHFHFAKPVVNAGGKPIVPPGDIVDQAGIYNLSSNNLRMGSTFSGFFTDSDAGKSAAELGVWPQIDARPKWECASTWLFPYGDQANPSRTLIIGPVLAGFLRYHFLESQDKLWRMIIADSSFEPVAAIANAGYKADANHPAYTAAAADSDAVVPRYIDVFNGGENAFNQVRPIVVHPSYSLPVAFNLLFDFMEYPTGNYVYPSLKGEMINIAGYMRQPFFTTMTAGDIPDINHMNSPEFPNPKGIHRFSGEGSVITLNDSALPAGTSTLDKIYFKGNLKDFALISNEQARNLPGRTTHLIDIRDREAAQEDKAFHESVFIKRNGVYYPQFNGIMLVRRSEVNGAARALTMPAPLELDRSLVIMVDNGDLLISGPITSPMAATYGGEAPQHLLTLAALQGNIQLGTAQEIHACLVALKHGTGQGDGGRLLSASNNHEINIFGGLAVHEMALYPASGFRTTMADFYRGGTIRYNPRFNPSSDFYREYRTLIVADKSDLIKFQGEM